MPKHEGSADLTILREFVLDLTRRYETLYEHRLEPKGTQQVFLYETAPFALLDLEQHPLGDKRQHITQLLNYVTACESAIIDSEKNLPN